MEKVEKEGGEKRKKWHKVRKIRRKKKRGY